MTFKVNPILTNLLGGSARTAMLAALANSSEPLTGYRIAQISRVQPIKVYAELRRLAQIGIVSECTLESGKNGWQMVDPDLRNFLRRRVRLFWVDTFLRDREKSLDPTILRKRLAKLPPVDLKKYAESGWRPRYPEDYERPPEKDKVLRMLGLPTSRRSR